MKKLSFFLMAMLMSIMSFAKTATIAYPGGTTTNMTGNNDAATLGLDASLWNVVSDKGGSNNHIGLNKDGSIRLYANKTDGNGNILTVSIAQGTIDEITLDIKQNATYNVTVEGNVVEATSSTTYAIGASSFSIQNVTVGATTQLHFKNITINYTAEGGEEPETPVVPEGPENLGAKTIAEFLELKNTTDTCVLTGVVANIVNTTYGNFDLVDATGSVYVYGLLTAAGESQKFASMDIAAGDTLTIKAIYNEYNSKPQAKNAIYVSHTKAAAPVVPENLGAKTIAEFLALKNTTDTCVLTGVVANIANTTYGNFDLVDATGTVYVYGLLTAAGESKQFASMDIAAGDTLTVKAIYNEYNSKPQAKNAIYVSHSKLVLTVAVTSENGTVSGLADGGKYVRGAEATLTATAAEGYEFTCWTSGEDTVSTENPYTFVVTADVTLVANFAVVEPEIEWMEMPLEISNLTTMEMPVDDVTYLRLMGRNDMDDADVMLFLNNYTGEEKAYDVNAESSYMTFGGLELTVMDGSITKSVDPELGDVYAGVVHASVYDDMMGGTMYLALSLTMYALSVEPVEVVVENATVVIEERSMGFGDATYSVLILTGEWSDGETTYPVSLETSEFDPEQESQEVAATLTVGGWGDEDPWLGFGEGNATIAIVDNTVSVSGLFENQDTGFAANATISGTLPADEPEVITWELNGGVLPLVGPTNAELWEAFKPYYNTYYDLKRADQPIDKVSTFANAYMQKIMTDEASEYKWLGDYVQSVATAAGVPLSTDMASANESGWRWAVHAFFNAAAGQFGAVGIDFTEAGKPENWVNVYPDAQEVVLPTEPVEEDYVLPTPTKSGSTFKGWYDNAEGTGEAYTVIPAGWSGTLYAIWEQGTTTALENIAVEGKAVKAIINGQLIIIKNGVQYNAQGAVVK